MGCISTSLSNVWIGANFKQLRGGRNGDLWLKASRTNWASCACPNSSRCTVFTCFTTIRAYRSVGSDLEPSTQPPLRGGKRIFSATVLSIDSVIESKIIFAHNGANSWIPETTVSPAPVRVSMHMLCISLHNHPRAIRTTLSSNRDVLVLPTAILINKC